MTYDVPQSFSPVDVESYSRYLDVAPYFAYTVPVPCVGCVEYFLPFDGETIWFQFNDAVSSVTLHNTADDTEITPNGVTIDGNQFSIDTSEIDEAISCFYIKVNGDCRLQHGYERPMGRETVMLESTYESTDLRGNDYTDGYENRVRFFGTLEFVGEEVTTEEDDAGVSLTKLRDIYELRVGLVKNGSWALEHLLKAVIRGKDLKVTYDGSVYMFDVFKEAVEKNNATSTDWLPIINLRTKAREQDYIC